MLLLYELGNVGLCPTQVRSSPLDADDDQYLMCCPLLAVPVPLTDFV